MSLPVHLDEKEEICVKLTGVSDCVKKHSKKYSCENECLLIMVTLLEIDLRVVFAENI